jgi:hypothetical protein
MLGTGGDVLDLTHRTLADLVSEAVARDIQDERYSVDGHSKAKRLRTFWKIESDYIVGKLILALVDYASSTKPVQDAGMTARAEKCRKIATRLLEHGPSLEALKIQAEIRDATHLQNQIRRIQESVEADPSLAIGTAKELIETVCKTILAERGKTISGTPEISTLTKETLKELNLVPEGIPEAKRGADVIKRLLRSLGTIGNDLGELRNLYGTGHGKHGVSAGLSARHARLAVGAASTFVIFLFDTHQETKP